MSWSVDLIFTYGANEVQIIDENVGEGDTPIEALRSVSEEYFSKVKEQGQEYALMLTYGQPT